MIRRSIAWTTAAVMLTAAVLTATPAVVAQHEARPAEGGLYFIKVADAGVGSDQGAPAAAGTQVVVDNFSFAPAMVTVRVGTTVTWTNHDDIPHNVVHTERRFKSPVLDTDERFSHTFEAAGTYKYYCSIHPKMTGQVVVR